MYTYIHFFERRREDSDQVDDFMVSARRAKASPSSIFEFCLSLSLCVFFFRCSAFFFQVVTVHGFGLRGGSRFWGLLVVVSVNKRPAA